MQTGQSEFEHPLVAKERGAVIGNWEDLVQAGRDEHRKKQPFYSLCQAGSLSAAASSESHKHQD